MMEGAPLNAVALYGGGPIEQLVQFNRNWAQDTNTYFPALFPKLSKGQDPKILWIGCSDSRVAETSLLGLLPGEVFVHRNIANLMNDDDLSLPAALHYAVEEIKVSTLLTVSLCICLQSTQLDLQSTMYWLYCIDQNANFSCYDQVAHVIICGHIGCGGVAAAAKRTPVGVAAVDKWLDPLRDIHRDHFNMITDLATPELQHAALVKLNVQRSLTKLFDIPAVTAAAFSRGMQVHGAIYDVGTGHFNILNGKDAVEPAVETAPEFVDDAPPDLISEKDNEHVRWATEIPENSARLARRKTPRWQTESEMEVLSTWRRCLFTSLGWFGKLYKCQCRCNKEGHDHNGVDTGFNRQAALTSRINGWREFVPKH